MLYTLKIRLSPSKEQTEQLLRTMARFNAACNAISQIAFKNKTFGKTMLQRLCYYQIRNEFKLSSQMVIRAIGKVCESYSNKNKRDKLHTFKPHGATVFANERKKARGKRFVRQCDKLCLVGVSINCANSLSTKHERREFW